MNKNEFLEALGELKLKGVNNPAHIVGVGVAESILHGENTEKNNENDQNIIDEAPKSKE